MERVRIGIALSVAGFFLMQILGPQRKPAPVALPEWSLWKHTQVPANVTNVLRRACMDCHSNETRWPWYSRVAPLSWQMQSDVTLARKKLNFSEWGIQAGRKPSIAISTLAAICGNVQNGRMPLRPYTLLHPEARLTSEDTKAICNWTSTESARYLRQKRAISSQNVYNFSTTNGRRGSYDHQ